MDSSLDLIRVQTLKTISKVGLADKGHVAFGTDQALSVTWQ